MEKRSITGKDILRMDGLLPPTRRVPVCDAVTGTPDKKKDKKWSIGGILKRISAIRDCDSSSNEEEMVYCKREPRNRAVPLRKTHDVVLHPVRKNANQHSNRNSIASAAENNILQTANTSSFRRDSIHSRSSDGSLDGLGRKIRKSKLKARAEAKRDRICGESSSDEDLHKSCNSLTRIQNEDSVQSTHKSGSCNRKSRAARTERYIKRLSKDEGHGTIENLNDISNKRHSLDYMNESRRSTVGDADDLFRPPIHPRRFIPQPNSYTFPAQRSSAENLRETVIGLPEAQSRSSVDLTRRPANPYITDLNQNNEYAKPARIFKKDKNCTNHRKDNNFFNQPGDVNQRVSNFNYVDTGDHASGYQTVNRSACPPEPPPRDPRCRLVTYSYNSFPFNGRHQRVTKFGDVVDFTTNDINGISAHQSETYGSNNEISWCGSPQKYRRRPMSLNEESSQFCNLRECTNNRHNSTGKHMDEPALQETEAMKCQRRNTRNDQLNSNFRNYSVPKCKPKLPTTPKSTIYDSPSPNVPNEPVERLCIRSPTAKPPHEYLHNISAEAEKTKQEEVQKVSTDEDTLQRRRSSKNLEEALSELEAIYNSLRLGDEDLLDRAERRSMEEFSLRQGKNDEVLTVTPPDSSDRSKDDMAYRRMHPKERPTSLSEIVGQSALSNISYLMASPILSRKDRSDNYLCTTKYPSRPDEPDVTRDDVVYRSIHHANNTLKVIDPQPPFGIPLGPVTTATESDYLHTTPTKPDHPRSPYIPQCEPDIVTDDLAYRTLRKDANTSKNIVESKTSIAKDPETTFGSKKKRAVRSLSANLYGLINHDRIHLRREPDLKEIADQFPEAKIVCRPSSEQECFRRVVSDGELSDYDTRWRVDTSLKKGTDINGNHSVAGINQQKLRVYVSPSTKEHGSDKDSGAEAEGRCSTPSDAALSSKVLDDDFWQDYLQSESNGSVSANRDTEADFSAYSRLCQDLVNLIKGPDDAEANPIKAEEETASILKQSVKINDPEGNSKDDEPPRLHIQSLGSHYSGSNDATRAQESSDDGDIEKLTESIINSKEEDSTNAEDNTLDFYLRLADENVKLIAEAFSSVADHLRDSRLSQKNSLTPRRSETENESTTHDTSTRSSLAYSQDDASNEQSCSSHSVEKSEVVLKDNIPTILKKGQEKCTTTDVTSDLTTDAELDLSRAVHDLQIAAASLCEHEKEIEELEKRLKKNASNTAVPTPATANVEFPTSSKDDYLLETEGEEERERDQEETVVSAGIEVRTNESDPASEGENKERELPRKSCDSEIVRSTGMRVSYVTNLITVMITAYSMVLLACFLALLLATVAAS